MITPKADVFERVEQTFSLFLKNILQIALPLTIFHVGFLVIFELYKVFIVGNIIIDETIMNDPGKLMLQGDFVMSVVLGLIGMLLYSFCIIVFNLATFKGIKSAYNEGTTTVVNNITYGFKNIGNAFRTYYFMFLYIALIPIIVLFLGLLLLLFSIVNNTELGLGITLTLTSIFLFIAFSIYRGTKAKFAICSAIDSGDFSKNNFQRSISYTKNNWWRIVGNLILISLAIGFTLSLIKMLVGIIFSFSSGPSILDSIDPIQFIGGVTPELQEEIVESLKIYFEKAAQAATQFHVIPFIKGTLLTLINAIFVSFGMTFLYIFFKRLQLESEDVEIKNITAMKHEARDDDKRERGMIDGL